MAIGQVSTEDHMSMKPPKCPSAQQGNAAFSEPQGTRIDLISYHNRTCGIQEGSRYVHQVAVASLSPCASHHSLSTGSGAVWWRFLAHLAPVSVVGMAPSLCCALCLPSQRHIAWTLGSAERAAGPMTLRAATDSTQVCPRLKSGLSLAAQ